MDKRRIGLYLGINSIGGAVLEEKRVVSVAKFDFASLEEEAKVEILNEEIKWETLLNRTLREMGVEEEKAIYISLADKDFIFRSFEMPLMKKSEIKSSLIYEIEKYIPFKIEELMWDYDYIRFFKEKKISISFLGMRKNIFKKNQDILNHLGLSPLIIEPSSLSLARIVKFLKKFRKLENFALLDVTESEVYLSFFFKNLPVFNRYLTIPKREGEIDIDRLVENIRVSFQYFRREFKFVEFERFIIISDPQKFELLAGLEEEIATPLELFTPFQITDQKISTLESLKAFGVLSREIYPYKFKPVLMSTQEQIEGKKIIIEEKKINLGILGALIGGGLILSILFSTYLNDKVAIKKTEIKREEESIVIPSSLKNISWKQAKGIIKERKKRLIELRRIKNSFKRISPFLEELPYLLSDGLWLDSLKLAYKKEEGRYEAELSGNVFLGDSYKERLSIDDFISNLRKNEKIRDIFFRVELVSSEKKEIKGIEVTSFIIKLK